MSLSNRVNDHPALPNLLDALSRYKNEQRIGDDGYVTQRYAPKRRPVSTRIIERLRENGVKDIPDLDPTASFRHRFYSKCKTDPGFLSALVAAGFDPTMPSEDVHVISRGTNLLMDINGADFLIEALEDGGFPIVSGQRILDFGGSSGRTVRTMDYGFPEANWACCDPSPPSIDWGQANLPQIEFFLSYQSPPLPKTENMFDGVIAKSIWTHFSEPSSRQWLDELSRVVIPGGFALITAHGVHDLARRITYGNPAPIYSRLTGFDGFDEIAALTKIALGVKENGYFFSPYASVEWQGDIARAKNPDTSNWGLTFVTLDWFQNHLSGTNWSLKQHFIGRTGFRHDLFLLTNEKG